MVPHPGSFRNPQPGSEEECNPETDLLFYYYDIRWYNYAANSKIYARERKAGMKWKTAIAAIVLLFVCALLFADTASIEYEFYMLREQEGHINVYMTDSDGAPLGNGSYYAVDTSKTVSDIQFMVAVANNYMASSSANLRISLKFEPFRRADVATDTFRGGYAFAVWRYEPIVIPVAVGDETVDWTFQAQPSTALQPNSFTTQNGIEAGSVRLYQPRMKAGKVASNNTGSNNTSRVEWGVIKTDHPLGETWTWYYGVGLQFTGTTEWGTTDYLEGDGTDSFPPYPPGVTLRATVTVGVSGI